MPTACSFVHHRDYNRVYSLSCSLYFILTAAVGDVVVIVGCRDIAGVRRRGRIASGTSWSDTQIDSADTCTTTSMLHFNTLTDRRTLSLDIEGSYKFHDKRGQMWT